MSREPKVTRHRRCWSGCSCCISVGGYRPLMARSSWASLTYLLMVAAGDRGWVGRIFNDELSHLLRAEASAMAAMTSGLERHSLCLRLVTPVKTNCG